MFCKYHKVLFFLLFFNLLWVLFSLTACSSDESSSDTKKENSSSSKTVRSNEPDLYIPKASGTSVIGQEPLLIDTSHLDQGYVMACYSGTSEKANVQLIGPDEIEYKYFIKPEDGYVTLPITSGDGTYTIKTYENISGTQYASLYTENIEVTLENDYVPYLYPNQYVNFSKESKIVSKASDIVKNDTSDLDAVSSVYHYVINNITYDTKKAERFFKERRIKFQFIDLKEKALSKGELQSVKKALSLESLINKNSKDYKKLNLDKIRGAETREEILLKNPSLYVTPIVRNGKEATVGYDIETWKKWE